MSGGLGDVVYALPTMRALGGGSLCLCPSRYTNDVLESGLAAVHPDVFAQLIGLLREAAPYIEFCQVSERDQSADYDLNTFRLVPSTVLQGPPTIAETILKTFNCDPAEVNLPWLCLPATPGFAGVRVHRTPRYHNPGFPWREALAKYSPGITLLGYMEEHAIFCDEHGYIPWRCTLDLLDLAREIQGSVLFIGNQSVGYAIAEGLKHRAILEQFPTSPNCDFRRADVLINPTPEQLPEL